MKRIRYEVAPAKGGWKVTRAGQWWGAWPKKRAAVAEAVGGARTDLQAGNLSQLIIKRLDGTIQDERTYGRDPQKTKG